MPIRPSIAREIFQQIKEHEGYDDSISYLRARVGSSPPTFETEHLDFKGAKSQGVPINDSTIKKIWTEALAGFANTAGGVLIFGIDARKDPSTQIDAANELSLVARPHSFRSRLQELHHQGTDPPIPGVEIEAFIDTSTEDEGFVVAFIPESDYKPHRCESAGKRWVMRIGDNFVDIPVSVLRGLFFPQRNSYIFLKVARINDDTEEGRKRSSYEVRLHNEGPASAHDLLLAVTNEQNMTMSRPPDWNDTIGPDGWHVRFPGPLHPGHYFAGLKLNKTFDDEIEDQSFNFKLYASDQHPMTYDVEIPATSREVVNVTPSPLATDRFRR